MSVEISACPSIDAHSVYVGAPQHQLRHLGPSEEAEGDQGRAESRGDVQGHTTLAIEPFRQLRTWMSQAELSTRIRNDDLAAVHVAGQHELVSRHEQPRIVAEEDPQAGGRVYVGRLRPGVRLEPGKLNA